MLDCINLVVDGSLRSDGGESAGSAAGDGSGGAINIHARSVSGAGSISADGGGGNSGVGGGGGRIAIEFLDISTLDINSISTTGGIGYYGNGANGTVYLLQEGEVNGELLIAGHGNGDDWTQLVIPDGYAFSKVILSNGARVLADEPLEVTGTLLITGNSVLSHSDGNEAGLVIEASVVQVDSGSSIDVTGRGYSGGIEYDEVGYTLGGLL